MALGEAWAAGYGKWHQGLEELSQCENVCADISAIECIFGLDWRSDGLAPWVLSLVDPDTLRKWVRLGKFPRIPLPGSGKDFRFSKEMIDEWARKRALGI